MLQDFPEDEVYFSRRGDLAILTLNRPKALNALSLDMIRQISSCLHRWKDDDTVKAVVFTGAGERAFCAGGDVKSFYDTGMNYRRGEVGARVPALFFAEEYAMNAQIFHYPKPLIAVMDGITMGGGYGIAGHCKYRIATENTIFAMPEVGIGLFPDVGAMYHLRKAGACGYYLAITGADIKGADMVQAGLADFFIQSSDISDLLSDFESFSEVDALLNRASDPVQSELFAESGSVQEYFAAQDLTQVLAKLQTLACDFASKALDALSKRSPTSLAVVDMYWKRADGMSFDDVIATDFTLIQHFISGSDMYEGIRAQVIDKDRKPEWSPSSLEDLSVNEAARYFEDTGYNLKEVQIFES